MVWTTFARLNDSQRPINYWSCVARLGQALELADVHRFLPKVFWLCRGRSSNRYGLIEYEFQDYAGRRVFAYGPPLVSGLEPIAYESAYLLAPGNLLGTPNSSMTFELQERSDFSAYWQDYPRRQQIPGRKREAKISPRRSERWNAQQWWSSSRSGGSQRL